MYRIYSTVDEDDKVESGYIDPVYEVVQARETHEYDVIGLKHQTDITTTHL